MNPRSILTRHTLIACLISTALLGPSVLLAKDGFQAGRNYDARGLYNGSTPARAPAVQAAAIEGLKAQVPSLGVQIDPDTHVTRSLFNEVGVLTGPRPGVDTKTVALDFIHANPALLGLTEADLLAYEITDDVQSKASPVRHLYLRQIHKGLPVYNGQLQVHVDREGRILGVNNAFHPNLAESVNQSEPSITIQSALASAASHLQRTAGPMYTISMDAGLRRHTVLDAPELSSRPIDASLMWLPIDKETVRLVWNFQVWNPDGSDVNDFTVDAESGKVWTKLSWVADAQYKIYPVGVESPQHITPLPPADGRVTVVDPHAVGASPFGWHDTNGAPGAESTRTIGNNVHAYTDTDANNSPDAGSDPDCGAALDCTFPLDLTLAPSGYRPAAVANLFYFNNIMHDVAYPFGFDEPGGNFQVNNYSNGGAGNDSVQAEAQDGSGTSNANFATPPDGSRPRMQMYIWTTPNPDRDGDLDNGIVAHEYGHGISNRLVGGPANTSCLGNSQHPGEGLSDWWALYYTQKNDTSAAARRRGIGTYALNQAVDGLGIRTERYDPAPAPAGNSWTYATINGAAVPHGVGSRWAQAYWQVSWALVDEHGYDADIDNFTGTAADKGNIRAMYYIIEGLKNTACSPTFVDVRNGIITAANAAPFNGQDTCLIWEAFAEFGLGSNAVPGGSNSTSPTNGFDIPAACSFLDSAPASASICAGANAVYPVTLGGAFTPPVTLSLAGNPSSSTATFATNPVVTAPSASNLTIGNTAGVAAGSYGMTVNAAYGAGQSASLPLTLSVFSTTPGTPALTAPANAAVDVAVAPLLTWTAPSQSATYVLEISASATFAPIAYTRTVTGNSHQVEVPLTGATQYFWRVRAVNPCGTGTNSPVSSFTTAAVFCVSPNLDIPDNTPAGVSSDLVIPNGAAITDLDLSLNVTHTYVGDLRFTLTKVGSPTSVIVIDQPGNCGGNDIDATLDDEAANPVETQCAASTPTISGRFSPNNPLSAFDGVARAGTWRLTAADVANIDLGRVNSWCLSGAVQQPLPDPMFANSFE